MKIIATADGSNTLVNENEVLYHSRHGAIAESVHVFIESGLKFLADSKNIIKILEFGFGTGLNAFLTYQFALLREMKISYVGLENKALPDHIFKTLNYTKDPVEVAIFNRMHTEKWDVNYHFDTFSFRKEMKNFEAYIPQEIYDLVYYDTFAPTEQAELWEIDMLQKCYDSLVPGGVWISYCAKGQVKRNLKSLGFEVQSLPGPVGKREITRAIK